jgi:hypothetical protein
MGGMFINVIMIGIYPHATDAVLPCPSRKEKVTTRNVRMDIEDGLGYQEADGSLQKESLEVEIHLLTFSLLLPEYF